MDDIRLESYSKALVESFADDAVVLTVLTRLGMTQRDRENYEPKIPELGDLIAMVKVEVQKAQGKPRDCEVCSNSRVVLIVQDGKTVAARCQCFRDWKSASCGDGACPERSRTGCV